MINWALVHLDGIRRSSAAWCFIFILPFSPGMRWLLSGLGEKSESEIKAVVNSQILPPSDAGTTVARFPLRGAV